MGSKGKKRKDQGDIWENADLYRDDTIKPSGSNRERDNRRNEGKPSADLTNGDDDESSEDQESLDEQTDLGLDPYVVLIEDLKLKLEATRNVTDDALLFYTNHQVEIQKIDTTRQQLVEMTKQCENHKIAIETLELLGGEKEKKLAKKIAAIKEERKLLDVSKDEAAKQELRLAEEKIAFDDMTRKKTAEQASQLQVEKAKLERDAKSQLAKRVEELEKATKKSQDDQRKRNSDLQNKNDELTQSLDDLRRKLKGPEKKCNDIEKLRGLAENDAEELARKLKMAENEFGLFANSTDYFQSEFLKIRNEVRNIAKRYVDQIKVDELDADFHDNLEEEDADFISVPISNTVESKELCLEHFQRVISSQLRAVLWQPFSSEITAQDSIHASLLNQIYDGLAQSSHEGRGLHAARTYAALTIRSLNSPPTTTMRTRFFVDNIMKVLSFLLNPKTHPALRKDLTELAASAISLWSTVQNDERELVVHSTLNLANFEKPEEQFDITDRGVLISFPRITARRCLEIARPAGLLGLLGSWGNSKPEMQIEEISIHEGAGIPEWGQLVRAGEKEEDERKRKQEIENREKRKRELEKEMAKEMEKLNQADLGHKRGSSFSRKNSVGVGKLSPSSPTSVRLGIPKLPERVSSGS